jgi:nicotinamide-nucleotide adenylyltransferase
MKTGLYIGRFQPFHKGHLDAVEQILKNENRVIIGIGSAEKFNEQDNPWSASQRYQMIEAGLQEAGHSCDQYTIIPIRNINNYPLWPGHVERLVPPFQTVYTGSPLVETLFKEHTQYPVTKLTFNLHIDATTVREELKKGENWQELVPTSVAKLMEQEQFTK